MFQKLALTMLCTLAVVPMYFAAAPHTTHAALNTDIAHEIKLLTIQLYELSAQLVSYNQTQTVVTSDMELQTALASVTADAVIALAPGVYSSISVADYQGSSNVTITSADPTNLAEIADLTVENVSNVTFDRLRFRDRATDTKVEFRSRSTGPRYILVNVIDTKNVTFKNSEFVGELSTHSNFNGYGLGYALRTSGNTTDLRFEHNLVTRVNKGIDIRGSVDGFVAINNKFIDYRQDGFYFHDKANNIEIAENIFAGIYPYTIKDETDDDHADVIQTRLGFDNAFIRDNFITTGDGSVTQGFFLKGNGKNLLVENNLLYTNMWHGGVTPYGHAGIVRFNTVLHNTYYETEYPQGDGNDPRLQGGDGTAELEYNVAEFYYNYDPNGTTNVDIAYEDYDQYYTDPYANNKATLDSFQLRTTNPFTNSAIVPGVDMARLKTAIADAGPQPISAAPVPDITPEVQVGEPVINMENLRVRNQPSLSAETLAIIPAGTNGTMLSDTTVTAEGYEWVTATFNTLVGWVASNFLLATTAPEPVTEEVEEVSVEDELDVENLLQQKIPLNGENIINSSDNFAAGHAADNLFDQCLTLENGCTTGGRTGSFFVTVDLTEQYDLSQVLLLGDTTGSWHSRLLTVTSSVDNDLWSLQGSRQIYGDKWFALDLDTTARYVRLEIEGTSGNDSVQAVEVALLGTPHSVESTGDRQEAVLETTNDSAEPIHEESTSDLEELTNEEVRGLSLEDFSTILTINNEQAGAEQVVAVAGGCHRVAGKYRATRYLQPDTLTYPIGLWRTQLYCDPGVDITIHVFLDKEYNTDDWHYRYYNESTGSYRDLPASYSVGTRGEKNVTVVTFTVTEGGVYDYHNGANGYINFVSGPGVQ